MIAIAIVVEEGGGGGAVVAGEVWLVVGECSSLRSMVTMDSWCVYRVFPR